MYMTYDSLNFDVKMLPTSKGRNTQVTNMSQQQISSCQQENFIENFIPTTKFVVATYRTKVTSVEALTPGDLLLQPIAAMSICDLSLDCTHKTISCSCVLQ